MQPAARDAQPAAIGPRGRQGSGMRVVLYLHTPRGLRGCDLVDNGRPVGWHRLVNGCGTLAAANRVSGHRDGGIHGVRLDRDLHQGCAVDLGTRGGSRPGPFVRASGQGATAPPSRPAESPSMLERTVNLSQETPLPTTSNSMTRRTGPRSMRRVRALQLRERGTTTVRRTTAGRDRFGIGMLDRRRRGPESDVSECLRLRRVPERTHGRPLGARSGACLGR